MTLIITLNGISAQQVLVSSIEEL